MKPNTPSINKFLAFLLLPLSVVSHAKSTQPSFEITPLIGYRMGGDFDIKQDGQSSLSSIKIVDNTSYGLVIGWPFNRKQNGEFLISHYNTNFNSYSNDNELLSDNGLGITYYHLGGNVPVSGGALPLWVTGGLGLTHLSPDDKELTNETRFSMNIGLNTQFSLSETISLRLGGRVYGTFFNSDSAIFCGTDACKVYISGNLWIQSEVNAGLTFKF
ncbi:MAG: hypothetical protein MJK12_06395 [Colwellia sp.]|nr:hypothetical protein [Colwellia sp.]